MYKTLQRGFTLIELLVVIAIIGILAAVVLASLNDARSGGQDAAIKQAFGNIRSQAEITYNANGAFSYVNVCNVGNGDIVQLLASIRSNNQAITAVNYNAVASATNVACNSTALGYAVAAPLVGQAGFWWCVDSTGNAGAASSSPLTTTTDISC